MRAPTIYKCSPLTNYQRVVTSSRLTLYHVMLLGHNTKCLYFKYLIKILTGFILYCIIFHFVQQEYPGKTMEEGREEIPLAPMGVLATKILICITQQACQFFQCQNHHHLHFHHYVLYCQTQHQQVQG